MILLTSRVHKESAEPLALPVSVEPVADPVATARPESVENPVHPDVTDLLDLLDQVESLDLGELLENLERLDPLAVPEKEVPTDRQEAQVRRDDPERVDLVARPESQASVDPLGNQDKQERVDSAVRFRLLIISYMWSIRSILKCTDRFKFQLVCLRVITMFMLYLWP